LCAEALQRAGAEKVCFEKYNFKGDLTGMKGIQGITAKATAYYPDSKLFSASRLLHDY
jgi:hypothetical protein